LQYQSEVADEIVRLKREIKVVDEQGPLGAWPRSRTNTAFCYCVENARRYSQQAQEILQATAVLEGLK